MTTRIVADCVAAFEKIKAQVKALEGVTAVRLLMCSTCCDFKIQVTMDADGELM